MRPIPLNNPKGGFPINPPGILQKGLSKPGVGVEFQSRRPEWLYPVMF